MEKTYILVFIVDCIKLWGSTDKQCSVILGSQYEKHQHGNRIIRYNY